LVRRFTLAFSAVFVLALATAQPHRVHHFFDEIAHERHHGDTESSQDDHPKAPNRAPQTECVVQAVSQHCSALPVAAAKIPIVSVADRAYYPVVSRWIYHFSFSPFLQRAPPTSYSSFSI
jgi:hypothetical protein